MSKKFICITQENHLTAFIGPSGNSYTSMKGEPFEVHLPVDIEFFKKKKQMEEWTLFNKPKIEKNNGSAENLLKVLKSLGISKKSVATLSHVYNDEDVLRTKIEGGIDLTEEISKTDAKKVVDHYMKQYTDNGNKTEEE